LLGGREVWGDWRGFTRYQPVEWEERTIRTAGFPILAESLMKDWKISNFCEKWCSGSDEGFD
jgi:hypothetical protein